MENLHLNHAPVAKAQMLIRRPVAEVFEAFANPAVTSRFWFTKGSGKLEAGKKVQWDWEMYGISSQVDVKAIEPNKRILVEWSSADSKPTMIEWRFDARPGNTTFVTITNTGFSGSGDQVVDQAIDSMGGFSLVLAGLKALLEHNVALNLVADHAPEALVKH
jgi:uncharacterized protein YndB with AHSA1/START domain